MSDMSLQVAHSYPHSESSWKETAIRAALDDLERVRGQSNPSRRESADLERAAAALIAVLPASRQEPYRRRLKNLSAQASSNGTAVYNNVVDLFTRSTRDQWTAAAVQEALAADGLPAEPKAVLNVLGYLERAGKIKRVARGHYLVLGALLVTSEEISGAEYGQTRPTEHDV
jgi:hypothetical protein